MTDNYSGASFTDPQSNEITRKATERKRFSGTAKTANPAKTPEKKAEKTLSELYEAGIKHLALHRITVELGDNLERCCGLQVLMPKPPPEVKGITYPGSFAPLQKMSGVDDVRVLEQALYGADNEVRDFWLPLIRPQSAASDLKLFVSQLKMFEADQAEQSIHQPKHYGHSFDPVGTYSRSPRLWVPAKEWFAPQLQNVTMADVWTIFPKAETELLELILGRIGVGPNNHIPDGATEPVKHTARMAAVIIGKDAGLGKSTLFDGLNEALSRCGFHTQTFRKTEDRFGMTKVAKADVAYKDDTAAKPLLKFLASEETKVLITNGLFGAEEKFEGDKQLMPKCVLIVNSNVWDPYYAYDLDPGIMDRIKLLSTYRRSEVEANEATLEGTVSDGTPDLRPYNHLQWLAEKLQVDVAALHLWCLRMATDRFYEVISDRSNPKRNRLEDEVREATTRCRVRFKADVTQALVNAMAFSVALRRPDYDMPELSKPETLAEHLKHLYFVGSDPSCHQLMTAMKAEWEKSGRLPTHYYQGFREVAWQSLPKAINLMTNLTSFGPDETDAHIFKKMLGAVGMRDGFQISTGYAYIHEEWEHVRHGQDELRNQAAMMREAMTEDQRTRLLDLKRKANDDWMNNADYSPDRAEELRPKM